MTWNGETHSGVLQANYFRTNSTQRSQQNTSSESLFGVQHIWRRRLLLQSIVCDHSALVDWSKMYVVFVAHVRLVITQPLLWLNSSSTSNWLPRRLSSNSIQHFAPQIRLFSLFSLSGQLQQHWAHQRSLFKYQPLHFISESRVFSLPKYSTHDLVARLKIGDYWWSASQETVEPKIEIQLTVVTRTLGHCRDGHLVVGIN